MQGRRCMQRVTYMQEGQCMHVQQCMQRKLEMRLKKTKKATMMDDENSKCMV